MGPVSTSAMALLPVAHFPLVLVIDCLANSLSTVSSEVTGIPRLAVHSWHSAADSRALIGAVVSLRSLAGGPAAAYTTSSFRGWLRASLSEEVLLHLRADVDAA